MTKIIGFCGLSCHECGAYLATIHADGQKRIEIASLWSKEYGKDFTPEDIHCSGCISEDTGHFAYCRECEIRKCCKEKSLANCAYCDEYPCEKLEKFFEIAPESKKRLDDIKKNID